MTLRRSRRTLAIFTLALLPSLSPALAQPRPRPTPSAIQPGVFDVLRGGFAHLRATLLGFLEKEGVGIDPNGKPSGTGRIGECIDLNSCSNMGDGGGGIDPNG
jgi:hypothetical protein